MILVIATSHKTRGGITAVVNIHKELAFWKKWRCIWIETHIDKNSLLKIYYYFRALLLFFILVPFCSIIHVHLSETTSTLRKSFFITIGKFLHKKIIIHFHSFSPETTILGKKQSRYKRLFKKADKIIVLSEYWLNIVSQTFNLKNIEIVYNPCDRIQTFSEMVFQCRKPIIIFAGTLNQRKGYADLIEAFSIVHKKFPHWKLYLLGNGEIDKAKDLANKLNVANAIDCKGWVRKEKDDLFRESSIFCLPSYAEGFPMAILDALSHSLPIVTTPVGGILDVFKDGENAMIFDAGDIKALSEKLKRLIESKELRFNLSAKSNEIALSVFSKEIIGEEIDLIYRSLVEKQ